MAYETKVILRMLANQIASAESLEEVYFYVQVAANVEGLEIPNYEEARETIKRLKKSHEK